MSNNESYLCSPWLVCRMKQHNVLTSLFLTEQFYPTVELQLKVLKIEQTGLTEGKISMKSK